MTYEERTIFLEHLIQKIHGILDREAKVDLIICFGRIDKMTGEHLYPQVQIREFGL